MKTFVQVICGGSALVAAILTGIVLHLSAIPAGVQIRLDPANANHHILLGSSLSALTLQQVEEYHKNGVVLVKGFLSLEEAVRLKDAATKANAKLFSIFRLFPGSRYKEVMFDLWRTSPEIASLSLQAIPKVASLLITKPENKTEKNHDTTPEISESEDSAATTVSSTPNQAPFRLLRDAFFEFAPPGQGCGWHVDDAGFWPSKEDTAGPTFWIALDPSSPLEGGGLAVLNRTAFQQAEPLGLTEEICRQTIAGATCDMADNSPACHAKMEASKLEFDLSPGDAIVWDRWTFHRGVAATDGFPEGAIKQRYSVRYIPHGARAFGAVHKSVEQGDIFESPYYPQVWPHLIESEMKALENGLDQDVTLLGILQFRAKRLAKRWAPFLFPEGDDVTNALARKPTKK